MVAILHGSPESRPRKNPSLHTEILPERPKIEQQEIILPNGQIRIIPEDGQSYTVTPLETDIEGMPFRTRILEPEDPITDRATLLAYGLGSNSLLHENEASHIARRGMPVVLHDEPRVKLSRSFSLNELMTDRDALEEYMRDRLNPLIFASEALSVVMDATQHHDEKYQKFRVKGHSKGGPTAMMLAAYEENVEDIVLDGPARIVPGNALWNHVSGIIPILTDEVIPMAKDLLANGPKDARERMIKYFRDDPMRLGCEIILLIARNPDAAPLLAEIKSHEDEVGIAVISHQRDRFFKQNAMNKAVARLMEMGLVDVYRPLKGTKHVNPNINPRGSAEVYESVMAELANKRAERSADLGSNVLSLVSARN
jgi:pimeloyl-ACP methyl ester carboxylesterase